MKVSLPFLVENLPKKKIREFREVLAHKSSNKEERQLQRFDAYVSGVPPKSNRVLDRKDDFELKEGLIDYLIFNELSADNFARYFWLSKSLQSNIAEHNLSKISLPNPDQFDLEISSEKRLLKYLYQRLFSDKANFSFEENISSEDSFRALNAQKELLQDLYNIESVRIAISLRTVEINSRKALPNNTIWTLDLDHDITLSALYELTAHTLGKLEDVQSEISLCIKWLEVLQPMDRSDFLFIYEALLSCVIFHFNSGKREYDSLNFELRRLALSFGIFDQQITAPTYRNIIFLAPLVGEAEWALDFLEEYKQRLPEGVKDSSYSFSKARLFMNMERYNDVIEVLRNVEYKNISFNLNSKLMLMAAFYELNEYDPLLSTIQAFKVFLRRRRNISVTRKKNFTDYCDALYNLAKAEDRMDKKRLEKATAIMDANPSIPSLSWLREKYHEVAKSIK